MARHMLRMLVSKRPIFVRNSLQTENEMEAMSSNESGVMKWYSCGPTVYDDAHLGHARTYVTFDIIRRLITKMTGTRIDYALGVTDIDDKIITRARERNDSVTRLARRYELRFFEDMAALDVLPPTRLLRVTEHVDKVCNVVRSLEHKGVAYASPTGNVYFSVTSRGERYGQLDASRGLQNSGGDEDDSSCEGLDIRGRDSTNYAHEKRDRRDFALWKRAQRNDAETIRWESLWGEGRPGWHIECSAMALHALGPHLDVHTGGIDLRFPHHTNELATAEALLQTTGTARWAHIWLHAGHLHMEGRKMSKSLKNFVSVREFLAAGECPKAFRVFCLMHRYAAPVEYSRDRIVDASTWLRRMRAFLARDAVTDALRAAIPMASECTVAASVEETVRTARDDIDAAIANDFNTPRVVRTLAEVVAAFNKIFNSDNRPVSGRAALAYEDARCFVADVLQIMGVLDNVSIIQLDHASNITRRIDTVTNLLVTFRAAVRNAAKQKDLTKLFSTCDALRDEVRQSLGVRIADAKDGTSSWTKE